MTPSSLALNIRTRRISLLSASVLFLFIAGCGGGSSDPGAPSATVSPGRFALSQATGLGGAAPAKRVVGPAASSSRSGTSRASLSVPSFDLGDIRATDQFFFILSNAGGASITGINITSDNPAFEVSPAAISELPPDTGSGSVTPVVRVTAVHGRATSGFGFANLLPAGPNMASINFSGTTTDSAGGSVAVTLDVSLSVNALLFDIQMTDAVGVINEAANNGTVFGIPGSGGGGVPVVEVRGDFVLANTGNVDIQVSTSPGNGPPSFLTTLSPATSVSFTAADFVPGLGGLVLAMDGGGTVSDQARLPILPNGLIMLFLQQVP